MTASRELSWLEKKGLWILADYGLTRPIPDLDRAPPLRDAALRGYLKLQVELHETYRPIEETARCEHLLALTASCTKCQRWCNELTPTPEE